eukprot:gene12406-8879_t
MGAETDVAGRLRLGRLTVDGETREYRAGEVMVFDDSFVHSVDLAGAQTERVVLLVDVWHPELCGGAFAEVRSGVEGVFPPSLGEVDDLSIVLFDETEMGAETDVAGRLRLGRLTVDGETREYRAGEVMVFDDSFVHSVDLAGAQTERVVLLVDVWHPALCGGAFAEVRSGVEGVFPPSLGEVDDLSIVLFDETEMGAETDVAGRLRLGRLTVDGETREYRAGEVMVFDDSFVHSVDLAGAQTERVVLLVDVWHPELCGGAFAEVRSGVEGVFPPSLGEVDDASGRVISDYEAYSFDRRLEEALAKAKTFLAKEKSQALVIAHEDARHRYEDKYLLTEHLTRTTLNALVNNLVALGLSASDLKKIKEWSSNSSILLRFKVEERCVFVREETKEETIGQIIETATTFVGIDLSSRKTSKHVYSEYVYDVAVSHRLEIIRGAAQATSAESTLTVWNYQRSVPYISRQQQAPLPDVNSHDDVDITWLIDALSAASSSDAHDAQLAAAFRINRDSDETWTPVRNPQVQSVVSEAMKLQQWTQGVSFTVRRWFDITMQNWSKHHRVEWSRIEQAHRQVFVPVVAFFEKADVEGSNHTAVSPQLLSLFHREETRGLKEVLESVDTLFPHPADSKSHPSLVSYSEARAVVVLHHMAAVVDTFQQSVDYVEAIMRRQLVAALGKSVTEADLQQYMSYHYRQLYRPSYQPQPWTVSVRRSRKHSPEGAMRLESRAEDFSVFAPGSRGVREGFQPIETFTRSFQVQPHSAAKRDDITADDYDAQDLMSFPIAAGVEVTFAGERHVHAWLRSTFAGGSADTLRLVAAAQQFSSFIVVLGRITSSTTFDPKYAFIVQNQEEVTIPLSLETIPNAKHFRDAIESLSPKQQRFARAYRAMQLESTLFGVVILQIKPQLEKALHLPADSLTKEIALTTDLMDLFIQYQIPTDLLSAEEGEASAGSTTGEAHGAAGHNTSSSGSSGVVPMGTAQVRVQQVKEHVRQMKAMLQQMKDEELKTREMEKKFEAPSVKPQPQAFTEQFGGLQSGLSKRSANRMDGARGGVMMMSAMSVNSATAATPQSTEAWVMNDAAGAAESNAASSSSSSSSSSSNAQPKSHKAVAASQLHAVTALPQRLDDAFDRLDSGHATRPTIINVDEAWTREKRRPALLATSAKTEAWTAKDLQREKTAAFELLDALTRSGALLMEQAALHVVVSTTHAFADSVMECVVQQNRNPIEDLERSSLVVVSQLHGAAPREVVEAAHVERLLASSGGGRGYEKRDVEALMAGDAGASSGGAVKSTAA